MKQLCAPLFLALCILQTLLATPVQAEFATFSASNLPLAPIQLAQEAIDFIVIRTRSEHSTSKSSSASIGVSYGTSGFNVSASASKSKGQGDGADLVHTNTTVSAGQAIRLSSGGDTTLAGATLTAPKVSADIGGNLTVQSLQDQSSYHSNSASTGGSVTVGSAPSASASLSKTRVDSDFQSVGTQSGIRAGDGGFQVNVKGDTTLVGGAITSTQAAIDNNKNSFTTGGTLTTTDLQNKAEFSAQSVGVSVGTSGGSAGIGNMGGNASSTTQAAISGIAGNKDARTGDAETGVKNGFDKDKVTQDVQAQVQITQQFGSQASKAVGDYASTKAVDLRKADNPEEAQKWEEGGAYRVALHTVVGALGGGISGALGAGAAAQAAPQLNDLQSSLANGLYSVGASADVAQAAAQLISGLTAAGLGAVASGGSAAGAALNSDLNNRQLHQDQYDYAKKNAKQVAAELSRREGREVSADEAEGRMVAEMLRNSDQTTNQAAGGVHDYVLRGIVGCLNLACNLASTNSVAYMDSTINQQYIPPNSNSYAKGLSFNDYGQTYNQLVTGNVKNNPIGATVAGAGMIGLGYLTGGAGAATGVKIFGTGVGAIANYAFQPTGQPTDWIDVGIAGGTGFLTSGVGLGSSIITNTGGALLSSGIKSESPNAGMGAAAAGTVFGYGVGAGVQTGVTRLIDPKNWYRPQWIDLGLGVSRPNTPSAVPGMFGNIFSSGVQEAGGNAAKDALQKSQEK